MPDQSDWRLVVDTEGVPDQAVDPVLPPTWWDTTLESLLTSVGDVQPLCEQCGATICDCSVCRRRRDDRGAGRVCAECEVQRDADSEAVRAHLRECRLVRECSECSSAPLARWREWDTCPHCLRQVLPRREQPREESPVGSAITADNYRPGITFTYREDPIDSERRYVTRSELERVAAVGQFRDTAGNLWHLGFRDLVIVDYPEDAPQPERHPGWNQPEQPRVCSACQYAHPAYWVHPSAPVAARGSMVRTIHR